MGTLTFQEKFRPTDTKVFLHTVALGVIFSELWYLGKTVGMTLSQHANFDSGEALVLVIASIPILVIGFFYFYLRAGFSDCHKLIQSARLDLLALLALGFFLSSSVGGIGTSEYQKYAHKIEVQQLLLLSISPIVVAVMLLLRALFRHKDSNKSTSFFIDDKAIQSTNGDLLNLKERANIFADRVLNGGSSSSLIFGIDAPWGIGKSSFINFCCERWAEPSNSRVIVHRFEPLRYAEKSDLVSSFVDDLVSTIQKHTFTPELGSLISKYSRIIKGKSDFSLLGINFEVNHAADTAETVLENLEILLSKLDRKVIIVVDDLDRVSWSNIKSVLYAIQTSFRLSNVAYILCYDTENIAAAKDKTTDAQNVIEFLEKFVNVKTSLFLDSSVLAAYVSENFALAVQTNLQIDSRTLDQLKQAIEALVEIYNSNEFHNYQSFIGDIRKVKRLINTLVLLEIEKTDFSNSDFDKKDLLHLLLIYVNYPHIFRKIYNTETNGKQGFFSLVRPKLSGQLENSENYKKYIEQLPPNQRYLVERIFNAQDHVNDAEFSTIGRRTLACCNDQFSGRSLERYLNLIVKLSKPEKREAYQFYVNYVRQIINGRPIDDVFDEDVFNFSQGDFSRDQLWRMLVNSTSDFPPKLGRELTNHIALHLTDYSHFQHEKLGAGTRQNLIYSLLKIIDEAFWLDDRQPRRDNRAENIAEIGQLIFGEGPHLGNGLLKKLSSTNRGPLGTYDLLIFRLYCSADRGDSLFNLKNSLSHRVGSNAPTSGLVTEIAKVGMREISQRVFQIFKAEYITPRRNFLREVDALSMNDLAGKYSVFVEAAIAKGDVDQSLVEKLTLSEKSQIKVFAIYQLTNSMVSSGVGCGFYDEEGKIDQHGIAAAMNEYLFDQCFNPEASPENLELFLDFLLMRLERNWPSGGDSYAPHLGEFTKILDEDRLRKYWAAHREKVLELNLVETDHLVVTANYTATYKEDLEPLCAVLDKLLVVSEKTD